jgi:hypothetical protein
MNTSREFHTHPSTVPLRDNWPLLIVDADEVILRFAEGFDRFLRCNGNYLDLVTYRLHGNVRRLDDKSALLDVEVTALLESFRTDLDWLDAVEDAVVVLRELHKAMDIVVLSNIVEAQAPARVRNLAKLDLPFALAVNTGPKGPFVKALAERAGKPVFFVDDISVHHASVAENAADVFRLHLIGDERLKPLMPPAPHAHLRADNWREADAFIRSKLSETA